MDRKCSLRRDREGCVKRKNKKKEAKSSKEPQSLPDTWRRLEVSKGGEGRGGRELTE
jgi:hypothetical protein